MSWQWWNYLVASCPADRTVVRLNLDETFVSFETEQRGTIVSNTRVRSDLTTRRRVYRSQRRYGITHVAIICDDSSIQPLLPQVMIGRTSVLRARAMDEIHEVTSSNVCVLRTAKGWNTSATMVRIIQLLDYLLRDYKRTRQFIMVLDAGKIHVTEAVAKAFRKARLWYCLIPAKMTYVLQPLDTHVFARYKIKLLQSLTQYRISSGRATLDSIDVIRVINRLCRSFFCGYHWGAPFDNDGYGLGDSPQARVSKFIRTHLGLPIQLSVSKARPSEESLLILYPVNVRPPWGFILPTRQSMIARSMSDAQHQTDHVDAVSGSHENASSSTAAPPHIAREGDPAARSAVVRPATRRVIPWLPRRP